MLEKALLASLAYFICYGGNWLIGQCMIERPIVVGAVAGLLMGDLSMGIIMGASLEAVFMGAVNIGGAISAEPAAATVFAVTFAVGQNISTEAALALAIPIGILSAFVSILMNNIILNFLVPFMDKAAAKNNAKAIVAINFGAWFVRFFTFAVILFIGVIAGHGPLETFVNNIPSVVMRGLNAMGGFLPAVGFSILLKMLWSKELAVYYILGFIMVSYLKLPLVAVAALGIVLILVIAFRDMELIKLSNKQNVYQGVYTGPTINDEVEDFLK